MACCGRPNNRANKLDKNDAEAYYERFAYLSSHQKAQQLQLVGSQCTSCAALTVGDPCSVCGEPKIPNEDS